MHSFANPSDELARQRRQTRNRIVWRATADQFIEAEAAAGGIDRELHMYDRKKHVIPWPFGRMAVEAEPEMQRVDCGNNRHEAHAEAEHERYRELKLSRGTQADR